MLTSSPRTDTTRNGQVTYASYMEPAIELKRTDVVIKPNNARVLVRPFEFTDSQRAFRIVARIMSLPEAEVDRLIGELFTELHGRHQKARQFILHRFEYARQFLLTDAPVSENRQLLIGAYFTQEYSLESAALFNPSMIWHPDQSNLEAGAKRFILSLRATGEGHVSSITFRSGVIDRDCKIVLDRTPRFVTTPDMETNTLYEKGLFQRKLVELGFANGFVEQVMAIVDDSFTFDQLRSAVSTVRRQNRMRSNEFDTVANAMIALAKSNYEFSFSPEQSLSERAIFPYSPSQVNGIEDARFVQFQDDDGSVRYYATHTAFDGRVTLPELLETDDFLRFRISTLNGPEVRNKGMALFPRKIDGYYAMLSRQDGENIYLMYSDMLHFWYTKQLIAKPTYPWEYVQLGNCGSPIETEAGWLVLTHGVGPMRKYSMGAFLLDLKDPTRVVGRLDQPLLAPNENEREGYVPNVVYSCGGLIHSGQLIIPYAMSDYASTFATVPLKQLLERMAAN
ncbi:MAG TPA: glycoside hydrolase family 130 protein [Lacipirellulaceae bacterium]|nr:glycoside hydrolase family 130 protein [Lacipirellulaceae bacterium]